MKYIFKYMKLLNTFNFKNYKCLETYSYLFICMTMRIYTFHQYISKKRTILFLL